MTDVNKATDYFTDTLRQIFYSHAPLVEKWVKGKKCKWLTRELKHSVNERDQMLRKAHHTKDPTDWRAYKMLCNKCTNDVRRAKTVHHRNLLNEKSGNPRKFWQAIKSIFPTKSSKGIPSSRTENLAQVRATEFSNYFKNAIYTLKTKAISLVNLT